MATILLVFYMTSAVSMIVIILLQRSEGGALGIGGGSGGGLVSGRGAANFMTRVTAILATIFFTTGIALSVLGHRAPPASAVVGGPAKAPAGESMPASEPAPVDKAPSSLPELKLPKLKSETPGDPCTPQLPQRNKLRSKSGRCPATDASVENRELALSLGLAKHYLSVHGAIHLYYRRRGLLVR